jgi:hypothetical protein
MLTGLVMRMIEKARPTTAFLFLIEFQVVSNLLMEASLNFLDSPLLFVTCLF